MERSKPRFKGIDAMTIPNPSQPVKKRLASDIQAIICLKQGDLSGLAVLVQHYQVDAVQAAVLIVRDRDLAEDIAQDAFMQAFRKIGQFDDRRPFGPWFLRIVIHSSLKVAARQKRSTSLDESEDSSSVAEWLIDPQTGPEELVETAQTRETIWQALEQLTPEQRAAVVLRYYLDQSESEMIQELNRPLTTIKWWLHAARQKLRKLLKPVHLADSDDQEVEHE